MYGTGVNDARDMDSQYKFITVDGMSIWISNGSNDCAANPDAGTLGYETQVCAMILVDINGLKPP